MVEAAREHQRRRFDDVELDHPGFALEEPSQVDDVHAPLRAGQHLLHWQPAAALVGRDHDFVDAKRICRLQQAEARIEQQPVRNDHRSEEHTSELQSLMRISYAVFCLKKKTEQKTINIQYYSDTQ